MTDEGITAGLTLREFVASFVIGSVGLLTFGTQPVLLGGLARLGRISNADIGYATTVELVSLAIASAVLPNIISRSRMRIKVAVAVLLMAVSSYLTFVAGSLAVLLILRAVTGMAAGACVAASVAVINQSKMPDRVYAMFYSVVALPQAILGYSFPEFVLGRFGLMNGFAIYSVICVIMGVGLIGFRDTVPPYVETEVAGAPVSSDDAPRWSLPLIITLIAVVVQQGGNMAGSAFIDPLAVANGFSDRVLGLQLALQLIMGVVAGGFVAWYAWRWPTWLVLVALGFVQAVSVLQLAITRDSLNFLATGMAFSWLWQMMLPFYTRLVIDLDPGRRVALILPGIGMLGLSVGPFIGSFGVNEQSVIGAFHISAAMLVLASLLYAGALWMRQQPRRPRAAAVQ